MGLSEPILAVLQQKKIIDPTPIQEQSIPHILQGEDVDFKLKEKNKFKYVDWIPVHEGLEKLKGIEFKMVNKLIKDRSKPEKNKSNYLKMG